MPKAIRIKNWAAIFEKSDLKKTVQWSWIALPIRFDGRGWRRLTQRKDFETVFTGFVVICEVAGLLPKKGLMVDSEGVVVDEHELEIKTGVARSTFKAAFDVLTDKQAKIEWLEWVDVPDIRINPDASGSIGSTLQDSTGQNRTEQNTTGSPEPEVPASVPPPLLTFPVIGGDGQWGFTEDYRAELSTAFPDLDVVAEGLKAIVWLNADPGRRKTAKGMKRFLVGWMGRAQNMGAGRARGALLSPRKSPAQQDQEDRERIQRQSSAAMEKQQIVNEQLDRIARLKSLSPDELAALKAECVADAAPEMRQRMEQADPLSGKVLSSLMIGKLKLKEMEVR